MTNKTIPKSVDEYINNYPVDIQANLKKIRQIIQQALPNAKEVIKYDIPTFDIQGIHLVSFAAWKNHISLYPIPAGDTAFQDKIKTYKKAKSTLYFSLDKPIPFDLVQESVILLKKEKLREE